MHIIQVGKLHETNAMVVGKHQNGLGVCQALLQVLHIRMICIAAGSWSSMHNKHWLPLRVAIHLIMYCVDV